MRDVRTRFRRTSAEPTDLYVALRRAGVSPAGATLVVLFLLEMFNALYRIPSTSGPERVQQIAFHTLLFALIGAGGAVLVRSALRRQGDAPEERLPSLVGTGQGVALRLAIEEGALAPLRAQLVGLEARAPAERLALVAQAVLSVPHAWRAGSIDPLPRMPEDKLAALAQRLVADAARRFPDVASRAEGASAYRAEPWVFVASIVLTSRLTIDPPQQAGTDAIASVLRNLIALAADAMIVDVRLSAAMPAADLAERDPAMRSLRG